MLYLLAFSYAICRMRMILLTAIKRVAGNAVAVCLFCALTIALTVNVAKNSTGTTRRMVVLLLITSTSAVTVRVLLQTADGSGLGRSRGRCIITGIT